MLRKRELSDRDIRQTSDITYMSSNTSTAPREDSSLEDSARRLPRSRLSRRSIFGLLSIVCVLLGVGYVTWVVLRHQAVIKNASASSVPISPDGPEALAALEKRPHIIFRSTAIGDSFGGVALAPLVVPEGPRTLTTLQCDRVYLAAGVGICLAGYQGQLAAYRGYLFDANFQTRYTFPLNGLPSRARISPDGRFAALTVFVTGHSYNEAGFSTQTTILDTASGAVLGELEQFTVWRDGARFQAADFNFWGVTFARDSDRFYATLKSGDKTYLLEGNVSTHQAQVLYENVECPSLSPDNTRVAFKKAIVKDGRPMWQLSTLELATLHETALSAETRSVDDQVEWLDNNHILYALIDDGPSPTVGENVWVLPTDGSGSPRIFLPKAYSPTVIH
jgi:hypothetical protein